MQHDVMTVLSRAQHEMQDKAIEPEQNNTIRLFVLTSESNERPSQDVTHVCVHSSVKEVYPKEFEFLSKLQHLQVSNGVQCIGAKAFKDCSSLKTVSMASSVQSIGYRSFYFTSLVTLELVEGLQTIGYCAFGMCQSLQKVKLPSTLKKIEDWAFSHCTALQDIEIPHGVETIGRLVFLRCKALKEISIPSTVETLGEWCFQDCLELSSVTLEPSSRLELRNGTFSNCQGLSNLSVPTGIEVIGADSFRDCIRLISVDLPHGLTHIHAKAFMGCTSLCALVIPDSTVVIGDRAFYGCTSLIGVEMNSQNIQFGSEAFANCPSLVNIALFAPSVDTIPQDLFSGCSKLEEAVTDDNHDSSSDEESNDDLPPCVPALQHRFEQLPVHEKCYHSSTTTTEDLLACIQEQQEQEASPVDEDDDDDSPLTSDDPLDMTPFHLVATSTTQRTDLLEVLLENYPLDTLSNQDSTRKTMMEYLLVDKRPTSLPLLQMVLQKTVVEGMTPWGKPSWRSSLSKMIDSERNWGTSKKSKRQALIRVQKKLESYSRCEVMSILELAVWKSKMENVAREEDEVHRDYSRLLCGANIVTRKVFGYLCDDSNPKTFVASSIFPYDLSWMSHVCAKKDSAKLPIA